MKTIVVCCLALVLLFAMCGIASGGEVDTLKKQIKELEVRASNLEQLLVQTVNEAIPIFQQAEALLDKKKGDFTCEEKVIIVSAAYYDMKIRLIVATLEMVQLEYNNAVARLKSLKEA